eukprot:gene2337-3064_t
MTEDNNFDSIDLSATPTALTPTALGVRTFNDSNIQGLEILAPAEALAQEEVTLDDLDDGMNLLPNNEDEEDPEEGLSKCDAGTEAAWQADMDANEDERAIFTEAHLGEQFGRCPSHERPLHVEGDQSAQPFLRRQAAAIRRALRKALPSYTWAKNYQRNMVRGDVVGGLTVSIILIPQSIAYALLADLPPEYGLYCAFIPLLVYALLGSSRHLCVGPFALVSLLVADQVKTALPGLDEQRYIEAILLLSFMVGVVQIAMGLARLGIVVSFLADSVVSGFTTASAILIMTSQLKHALGLALPSDSFIHTVYHLALDLRDSNLAALSIFVTSVVSMHAIKLINSKFFPKVVVPEQLLVVVMAGILSFVLQLDQAPYNVDIVGKLPSGLPKLAAPVMNLDTVRALCPAAVVTAIISYMVSISIVHTFATKLSYRIDPNQEFIALGAANLVGSFFQAYPSCGSLSRSAVCANVGARTQAHNVAQAAMAALAMLLLTPLFHPLPYATLAAIVMMALQSMLNFPFAWQLYRTSRGDFVLWMLTFLSTLLLGVQVVACPLSTLLLGVQVGIGLGIVVSMSWLLEQTSRPWWARLGRLPSTQLYRNDYFTEILEANMKSFRMQCEGAIPLCAIVVDASGMSNIDASAELKKRSPPVHIVMADCKGPLRVSMRKSGLSSVIGEDHLVVGLHDAVRMAEDRVEAFMRTRHGQY